MASTTDVCIVHASRCLLVACETVATKSVSCCLGSKAQRCRGVCWMFLQWHYFVNMSAMLSRVPILCTDSMPLCTSCCMNRYFRSMCFAFFDDPILVAMLFPLVESVWIRICSLLVSIVPVRKFLMCSASCTPVPIEYSSDSALDSATIACVLDPKWIVDPMYLIVNPVVDFLVVVQPAQSAST